MLSKILIILINLIVNRFVASRDSIASNFVFILARYEYKRVGGKFLCYC